MVVLEGVVVGEPRLDPAPWPTSTPVRAVVRVERLTARGRVGAGTGEVLVTGDAAWLAYPAGSRVRAVGRLAPLAGRRPAALSATRVELVAPPSSVGAAVARLRAGLRDATDALPSDARGLVPGAAIGDTSRLPADLEDAMRVAGLSHLVAVSGQHVAVVVLATLWLASVLRAPRWLRAVLALIAAVGFAVLVGGGPSVLRAVATGAVAAVGLGLGRRARPLPALAAVVIGLLVVDPWATGSLGFQLSVVATAAIVLLAAPAAAALGGDRRLARRLLPVLTVPLAAQSAVGPVLVLVDPVVSWWAVPANVAWSRRPWSRPPWRVWRRPCWRRCSRVRRSSSDGSRQCRPSGSQWWRARPRAAGGQHAVDAGTGGCRRTRGTRRGGVARGSGAARARAWRRVPAGRAVTAARGRLLP